MKISVAVVAALVGMAVEAVPTYTTPYPAEECHAREGVGHVLGKLRAGNPVKVAYLGGSITEIDGWRRLSREWLQQRYPSCVIGEIAAAIGGTGSSLGVFRLGGDVLAHDPDLLFVEFATNDASESPETIWRNFEGIVRQVWRHNPETDIVFVYTITEAMVEDYKSGKCPRAASAMEMLADHYGIPSICFGPRVAADVAAGKLVMTIGEVETAVPPETPNRDQAIAEELAKKGQKLFSKDGTHPVLDGAAYYLESIKAAWPQFEAYAGVADHAAKLETTYFDASYEKAKLVSIDRRMLRGTWRTIAANEPNAEFADRFGCLPWFSNTPGSRLKFRFRGTKCMLYQLLGPDCGQFWRTIDGIRRGSPTLSFDRYCTYYRLASQPIFEGADGVHSVELELDDQQPDRTPVSVYLSNPEQELKTDKYNGTTWYVGKLMLVGDLEIPEAEGNWFDAHVRQYDEWPDDAVVAEGGNWCPGGLPRAALLGTGVLDIEALDGPLSFEATAPKTIAEDARSATVEADVVFDEYARDRLPEVDPNWKGGVVLSRENGTLSYFGLARVGKANAWIRLEGPEVGDVDEPVRLSMTVKSEGSGNRICYAINGVVCSSAGVTNLPLVVEGEKTVVSRVSLRGLGALTRLVASTERVRRGLFMVVH